MIAAWAVLVFVAYVAIDYAHARYVDAVTLRQRHRAVGWTLMQWGAASLGFVLAVEVSLWLVPFEGLGLVVGTYLAVPNEPRLPAARVVSTERS